MTLSVKLFLIANTFAALSSASDTEMVAKKASGRKVRVNHNRRLQGANKQKGREGKEKIKKEKSGAEKKVTPPHEPYNNVANFGPPPQYEPLGDSNSNFVGGPYEYPSVYAPNVQSGYVPYPENGLNGSPENQYVGYPENQYSYAGSGFGSTPENGFYGYPGNGINGNPETNFDVSPENGNPSNLLYSNPETANNIFRGYPEAGSAVDSDNGQIFYPENQEATNLDNPNTFSENSNEGSTVENLTPEYPAYETPVDDVPQTENAENADNGSNELGYPTWEDLFALGSPVISPTLMPTRRATTVNFNQFRVSQSSPISSTSPSSSNLELLLLNLTPSPTASPVASPRPIRRGGRPPHIRQIGRYKTTPPISISSNSP